MKNLGMFISKILAVCGLLGMTAGLLYGFIGGDFLQEGGILLSIPWGIITLVDIYISFLAFCGWIIYRENALVRSLPWTLFVLVLGSFTICLYLFIALQTSDNDWKKFWQGRRLQTNQIVSS